VEQHGSLAKARSAARLSGRRSRVDSRKALLRRLRALEDRDVRLTAQRLRELGEEPLLMACYQLFGSLPAARSAAGVAHPRRSDAAELPGELILDALRGRAGAVRVLATTDVDAPLARAARKRFGTLRNAIVSAGLTIGPSSNGGTAPARPQRRVARRRRQLATAQATPAVFPSWFTSCSIDQTERRMPRLPRNNPGSAISFCPFLSAR